jgi:glycosyltransferase involved in cell wall biosynthesis
MRETLLVLSQCLPFPPHSGVANRTYHILLQLQQAFDIHLVAFSRRNHQPDIAAREHAQKALAERLTRVYLPAPLPAERSWIARASAHLSSVLSGRPYTYFEYQSPLFERGLREATMTTRPALVHVDSLDLFGWLEHLPPAPVAVTHHSIESDLLRARARRIPSRLLAGYLRLQARSVERVEQRLCPALSLNVVMSETDADKLRLLAPGSRTVSIPNGVDTTYFTPAGTDAEPGRLVFIGPTYMYPNRDAIDWFIQESWAPVRQRVPEATLHLIGKDTPTDRARYQAAGSVQCHGYLSDLRDELRRASCSIVPIRIGGGTRLKILDSWAAGVPVVSTSVGCEGLAVRDGENILVRDDPAAFAEAVVAVLTDPALRHRIGASGRLTAEQAYDWRIIGDRLIAAYRELIVTGPTGGPPGAAARR